MIHCSSDTCVWDCVLKWRTYRSFWYLPLHHHRSIIRSVLVLLISPLSVDYWWGTINLEWTRLIKWFSNLLADHNQSILIATNCLGSSIEINLFRRRTKYISTCDCESSQWHRAEATFTGAGDGAVAPTLGFIFISVGLFYSYSEVRKEFIGNANFPVQ